MEKYRIEAPYRYVVRINFSILKGERWPAPSNAPGVTSEGCVWDIPDRKGSATYEAAQYFYHEKITLWI